MVKAQPKAELRFEKVNGLSQNTVYSIMKDKQGFMWIATADGLNRYDGVEMKVYKPPPDKKLGQLRGRTIRTAVLEDDAEQLWFSTEIAVFNYNKRKNYFQDHLFGMKNNKVLELNADPIVQTGKIIWFANSTFGAIEFDTITKQSKNYVLKDSAGNTIYIQPWGVYDKKNRLWFASNKGLFAFDIIEKKWQQYLPGTHLYKVAICADTVYASSGAGVFFIPTTTYKAGSILFEDNNNNAGGNFIMALYTDYRHCIWAGDDKGNVYCKQKTETSFSYKGNINGPNINQTVYPVYCFYADELGTLWVGADVLGLLKAPINPTGFSVYPIADEKKKTPHFFVTSIYEDENDKIWLGTYQMGLVILDKKTGLTSKLSLPGVAMHSQENIIGFIKKDNKENIWVGTNGYLFVKEKEASIFRSFKIPAPSNSLAASLQASSFTAYNNGWLLGTSLGLYFVTPTGSSYTIQYLSALGQSKISEIWIDRKNAIWIAFEGLGLFIAKDIAHLKDCTILFSETGIKSFLYDAPHEILWISSLSGLVVYHLPTGKFKNFIEADGLGNSYIYGCLKNKDDLWLSTNRGLSKASISFKKNNLLPDLTFTNFTSNDGLPDDEFNTGAFYKGNSGLFYFGTIKGGVWFNPDKIKPNHNLPQTIMTGILVNGEAADSSISPEYTSSMQLPYFKNNLFFRFRGLEYSNAAKVNYAYQLKGWDKDWVYSGTLNEVRYNNLPHGNYIFKVKASNASGVWNEKYYAVAVVIYPPFWQTWWFYFLEILFAAAVIIFITRTITSRKLKNEIEKLERQKALEEERHRISQEMHDDIGAGLTQISLISEAAKSQSGLGKEIKAELEDISLTSRQLVDNIGGIIWALNPKHNTLEKLLSYLREQLHKLLEYGHIDYTIQFPVQLPLIELNNKQLRNILLITKEIVHNAIKHSKANTLTVSATLIENELQFIIKDDGVGLGSNINVKGNGMKNIRQRVEELNGTLQIKPGDENGVSFIYSFTI